MAEAENQIRKAHKRGSGTDRLVTAARLSALERNLGIPIKRHRNPDNISLPDQTKEDKDETFFLSSESG
jgi:hypothetical protein